MKDKKLEILLFSTVGLIGVFVIFLALNWLVSGMNMRFDLTEDKLYSLSDGTRAILKKLDTPVTIRLYSTEDHPSMPLVLKNHSKRVEDLLIEYKQSSNGLIQIEKLNPKPDSDAEDSAGLDGVRGHQVDPHTKIYLGLAVSMLDKTKSVPFLMPARENLLEYDISRAISEVLVNEKTKIGVMSGFKIFGDSRMGVQIKGLGQEAKDPWLFVSELEKSFEVIDVPVTSDTIDPAIKLLVVHHPMQISEQTQFAIDQFILGGGKVVAMLDPSSFLSTRGSSQFSQQGSSSSLPKLLEAWGVKFSDNQSVVDRTYATRANIGTQPKEYGAILSLTPTAINSDDVVTNQINLFQMLFAGTFSGEPVEGLTQTVLVHTSEKSQLVESFMAQHMPDNIDKNFKPSNEKMPLAIRLTGKFKTAFPDGKPEKSENPAAPGDQGKKEKKKKSKDAKKEKTDFLKESTEETSVVLIGDSDFVYDNYAADIRKFGDQKIALPVNGNLDFLLNNVDQLSGDNDLIAVRSRGDVSRPFTKVKELEAAAEEQYREKIQSLEESLKQTQQRLTQLQMQGGGNPQMAEQQLILSPEQEKEIEKFREQEVEVNKELKAVRKALRQDIESLKNKISWINIAGMPFLVICVGIAIAVSRKKKTAAK